VPIDDVGGKRLLLLEGQVEDGPDRGEGRVVEAPLPEDRREPGRHEAGVALAQGDGQFLRQS